MSFNIVVLEYFINNFLCHITLSLYIPLITLQPLFRCCISFQFSYIPLLFFFSSISLSHFALYFGIISLTLYYLIIFKIKIFKFIVLFIYCILKYLSTVFYLIRACFYSLNTSWRLSILLFGYTLVSYLLASVNNSFFFFFPEELS